ncbi:MAG TPA: iron-sulfur cluster assembly accessory protein [Oceanospirillales bacterium]|jgi:Fe-S cluster assembly protein SufA/iron-sulfur cluster assembly protein|nr:iron-sulfur cluster assembly accessory protein [Oleispira sp.]HCM05617.1 iron-sulfur cluster assembly accessory protein [Oceanospirillales bacterium]|tara:strand:+ start:1100 stop:1471 length:372 start_codon:yes stop_codon:yes gene_type:complete
MTIETFDPNAADNQDSQQVSMTAAAMVHVRKLLENADAIGVRIGVKKSGCSGFKYDIEFVTTPLAEDTCFQVADDIALYVPTEYLAMVKGTEVDYTTEGLNSTIKFNNPNAKDLCGCGESFSV